MNERRTTLRHRLALAIQALFGDAQGLASVSVRVDDGHSGGRHGGWDSLSQGPADRPWAERADDLDDALEAWRKNFLVRRLVALMRSYVVGNGITVTSANRQVDTFIRAFWSHRKNLIDAGQEIGYLEHILARNYKVRE